MLWAVAVLHLLPLRLPLILLLGLRLVPLDESLHLPEYHSYLYSSSPDAAGSGSKHRPNCARVALCLHLRLSIALDASLYNLIPLEYLHAFVFVSSVR